MRESEREREREKQGDGDGVKRKNARISMSHREEITLLYIHVGWTEEEHYCTKCIGGRTSWVEINRQ